MQYVVAYMSKEPSGTGIKVINISIHSATLELRDFLDKMIRVGFYDDAIGRGWHVMPSAILTVTQK